MDKNNKKVRSGGGPQHNTEDMALSLQDKVSCGQKKIKRDVILLANDLAFFVEPFPKYRAFKRGKKSTRYCDGVPILAVLT